MAGTFPPINTALLRSVATRLKENLPTAEDAELAAGLLTDCANRFDSAAEPLAGALLEAAEIRYLDACAHGLPHNAALYAAIRAVYPGDPGGLDGQPPQRPPRSAGSALHKNTGTHAGQRTPPMKSPSTPATP